MKGDIDLLIEEKWRKWDEFANFISAIEKLPSPNEKNIALNQGNNFIDVYKTFSDNHYGWWIKELLPISIVGTSETASTFARCYLGVTDLEETELNIGMCDGFKNTILVQRYGGIFGLSLNKYQIFWRGSNCFPQTSNEETIER